MASFRCLMVDVDGVLVVRPPGRGRWDSAIEADLGIRQADLQARFFLPHWEDIAEGRADVAARLAPVLSDCAPHLTVEQVLDYWFAQDSLLDTTLLDDLAALRATGVAMHLCTVQEHRRAGYLWDVLRFRERFDVLHYSAAYGSAKPAAAFFEAVVAKSGYPPGDLMLIDDYPANVESARECGWQARLWTGEETLAMVLAR